MWPPLLPHLIVHTGRSKFVLLAVLDDPFHEFVTFNKFVTSCDGGRGVAGVYRCDAVQVELDCCQQWCRAPLLQLKQGESWIGCHSSSAHWLLFCATSALHHHSLLMVADMIYLQEAGRIDTWAWQSCAAEQLPYAAIAAIEEFFFLPAASFELSLPQFCDAIAQTCLHIVTMLVHSHFGRRSLPW